MAKKIVSGPRGTSRGDPWAGAIKELRTKIRSDPDPEAAAARTLAECAGNGDTKAAREILDAFAWTVETTRERNWPGPIPHAHAVYLAQAFRKIIAKANMDGEGIKKALGLKTSDAGRRAGTVTHDHQALAALYFLLRRDGLTAKMAESEIHTETGASDSTLRSARRIWRIYADKNRSRNELVTAVRPLATKWKRIRDRSK